MSGEATTLRPTSLDREADRASLSVQEQIDLKNADNRKRISEQITTAFIKANFVVLCLLGVFISIDTVLIVNGVIAPPDRVITSDVVMAVIGATTVQLGALVLLMGKYVFPSGRSDPPSSGAG